MVLDFPANPTNGQTYDAYYWDASTSAWRNNGSKNALSQRLTALETTTSTYPSGLVPVIPTSVAVGSGSASVSGNGVVTFTGVSSVSLNNVFSSNFKSYRIVIPRATSPYTINQYLRLRSSGTDFSTANYIFMSSKITGGGTTGTYCATGQAQWAVGAYYANDTGLSSVIDLHNPASAENKLYQHITNGHDGTYKSAWFGGGSLDSSTAYDGITLLASAGTISGTFQVYGYR